MSSALTAGGSEDEGDDLLVEQTATGAWGESRSERVAAGDGDEDMELAPTMEKHLVEAHRVFTNMETHLTSVEERFVDVLQNEETVTDFEAKLNMHILPARVDQLGKLLKNVTRNFRNNDFVNLR